MINVKGLIVDGVNICYEEVNGESESTIFFLHGNSSSRLIWKHQLRNKKLKKYRLVAFDLPAHGGSGTMNDYSLPVMGEIMADAIKLLDNGNSYILVGLSLGTNIISEMLAYNIHPNALVLAGPCIIGNQCKIEEIAIPDTVIGLSFVDNPALEDIKKFAQLTCVNLSDDLQQQIIKDYQSVKGDFRSRLGRSITQRNYSDQIILIAKRNIPALIIFGAQDGAIYPNYLDSIASLPVWNNKIIKLENAGHWVHLDQPEAFDDLLQEICLDVF